MRLNLGAFLTIAMVLFSAGSARAQSYSWSNTGSGDWTDSSKWTPTGVPGPSDNATIALVNSGPTVSSHITVGTVNVSNAGIITINGGQILTVTSAVNLNQINNISGGTLEITPTCTLTSDNAANATTTLNVNLKNDGTVTCHTGFLSITSGASTGTFNATQPNTEIFMPTPGANTMIITNGALNGHFQVGGFGNSALQIDKPNFSFAGTLELFDFITGTGSLNLASGGLLNIRGPGFTRIPGITIPVAVASGATFHLISDAFNKSFTLSSQMSVDGTLQLDPDTVFDVSGTASSLTLNADLALSAIITGNGSTKLNAGKTITCSSATGLTQILSVFDNFGTVNVQSGKLELSNSTNEVGAAMNASGVGTEIALVSGNKQLTNSGALSGAIRIRNGAMAQMNALSFPGKLILDNGFVFGTGSIAFTGQLTLDKTFNFPGNGFLVPTTFSSSSSVTVGNGLVLSFTMFSVVFDGAVLVDSGAINIDSGHTLTFNKTLTLTNSATANGPGSFVIGSAGTVSGTGTFTAPLTNNGTINVGSPTGTITVNSTYTQIATGILNLDLGGPGAGAFDVLAISGAATLGGTLNVALVNGFAPAGPLELTVITYPNVSGDFGTVNVPASPQAILKKNTTDLRIDFGITNPVPTLTSFVPQSATAGTPDLGLLVKGTNFLDISTVTFNGQVRQSFTISPTELIVFLPASDLASASTASIVVNNPGPGGGPSSAGQFAIVSSPPPIITSFVSDQNPGLFTNMITFELTATDADTATLSYNIDFGDATPPVIGTFAAGATTTVSHLFALPGTYAVTASVSDGANTVAATPITQINPAPNSGGLGVLNISNNTPPIVEPVDKLSIKVNSSNGGVIELLIDIASLTRNVYTVSTDFSDFEGRAAICSGLKPVHKYLQQGIFVAKSTAKNSATSVIAGTGRKTLVVSAKETGEAIVGLGVPSSTQIVAKSIKGKFGFSGTAKDSVSLTATIAIPSGLDLSQGHAFSIALGNVVIDTTIDAKGRTTLVNNSSAAYKSLKLKYNAKKGSTTTGAETATVTLALASTGLLNKGYDTEGISKLSTDTTPGGAPAMRFIQAGILLDGVPYESLIPVTFAIDKKAATGSIQLKK